MSFASNEKRYSLAEHGTGSQRESSLNRVLRQDARGLFYYGLNYAENGTNVIRIWPNITHDEHGNKVWTPFRNSLDVPMDFGDWIRRYPVARKIAGTHLTFIIGDPAREYDFSQKPINVLHDAVQKAIKAGQERPGWSRLVDRSGAGQLLQKSQYIYLVQCGLFMHGTKSAFKDGKGFPGVHPDCYGVVMELTEAAGRNMLTMMDQRREVSSDVAYDDFEARFVNGDPISWDHGRFVVFYRKQDGDPRVRRAYSSSPASISPLGSLNVGAATQKSSTAGYDCFIESVAEVPPQGMINAITPAELRTAIESKIKPWDDILWFPSEIEQAHMIAPLYPADLVMYAFGDRPEWIPDAVRAAAVGAVSAAVPAGLNFGTATTYQQRDVAPAPVVAMQPVPQAFGQPVLRPVTVDKAMQQLSNPPVGFGTVHVAPEAGTVSTAVPGFAAAAPVTEFVVQSTVPAAEPPVAAPPASSSAPVNSAEAAAAYALNLVRNASNKQ